MFWFQNPGLKKRNAHMVIDYLGKSQRNLDHYISRCEQFETSADLYLSSKNTTPHCAKKIWIFMDLKFIKIVCYSLH